MCPRRRQLPSPLPPHRGRRPPEVAIRYRTHRLSLAAALLLTASLAQAAPIEWSSAIAWTPFDQALERARAENKAVCVVVYADWCPKCRNLAPAFSEPPITEAASGVIMVLQNSEERPEWLQKRFGDLGNYVPRVFFLRPDGTVNRELTSDHPRFPFFYTPAKRDLLAQQMRKAAQPAGPASAPAPQPAPSPAASAQAPAGAAAVPPAAAQGEAVAEQSLLEDRGVWVMLVLLIAIGLVVARLGRKDGEA